MIPSKGGGFGSGLSGLSGMAGLASGLSTVLLDEATDANGTAIGSHTIAPVRPGAAAWSVIQGGFDIQSNQFNATGATSRVRADAGVADGAAKVDIVAAAADTGRHGLILRATDSSNFWFVCVVANSNQFEITERNAGAVTVRASVNPTITAGNTYVLRAVFSGQTISATLDGANDISYGSAALNETVTQHGMCSGSTVGARLDDFEVLA